MPTTGARAASHAGSSCARFSTTFGELRCDGEHVPIVLHDDGRTRRLFAYVTLLIPVHGLRAGSHAVTHSLIEMRGSALRRQRMTATTACAFARM